MRIAAGLSAVLLIDVPPDKGQRIRLKIEGESVQFTVECFARLQFLFQTHNSPTRF